MTAAERWYATGRRKEATARVFLTPGTGKLVVNKQQPEEYFRRATLLMILGQPFDVTETNDQFDVYCTVSGGQ